LNYRLIKSLTSLLQQTMSHLDVSRNENLR